MNKHVIYIILSILSILVPIIGIIYSYWDASQPKVGPIGDGIQVVFTPVQLAALMGVMLTGALNLVIAIKAYVEHTKPPEDDSSRTND
ncbi:hypothetical protein [Paenibacillus sp. YYML68]|uniref:hypothetical protein n=1 Tax=Paenibacillus sp. YYML68 TaxID=2909250 RepID=UPI0024929F4C|nr:hypothetical protein [Paenibacillus sp. YYML68]